MYSVDIDELEPLMRQGGWEEVGGHMASIAGTLERGGAAVILLCTNTVQKVAGWIERAIEVPFIHIADATGEEITNTGLKKVALLGTRHTMEGGFYKDRLTEKPI